MRDGHIYDSCYRRAKGSWHEDRAVCSGGSDGKDKGECEILLRRVMSRKALTGINSKRKGRETLSRGRTPIREVYLAAVLHRTLKRRSALSERGEVVLLRVRVNEEESPIDLLKPRKAAISPSSPRSAVQLRAHIFVVLLIQIPYLSQPISHCTCEDEGKNSVLLLEKSFWLEEDRDQLGLLVATLAAVLSLALAFRRRLRGYSHCSHKML